MAADQCPSEDSLANFMQGELSTSARHDIEAHLDTCRSCSALLAYLARTYAEAARQGPGGAAVATPAAVPRASPEASRLERVPFAPAQLAFLVAALGFAHAVTLAVLASVSTDVLPPLGADFGAGFRASVHTLVIAHLRVTSLLGVLFSGAALTGAWRSRGARQAIAVALSALSMNPSVLPLAAHGFLALARGRSGSARYSSALLAGAAIVHGASFCYFALPTVVKESPIPSATLLACLLLLNVALALLALAARAALDRGDRHARALRVSYAVLAIPSVVATPLALCLLLLERRAR